MGGGGSLTPDALKTFIEAQNLKAASPAPINIVEIDTPNQEIDTIDTPNQEMKEAAYPESPPKGKLYVFECLYLGHFTAFGSSPGFIMTFDMPKFDYV
jgi:hypothetical protein